MADPQKQQTDPYGDFHDVVRNAKTTAQTPYDDFNKVTQPKSSYTPPAKEPGLIDTANAYYNAPPAPGEGTIARIGRSLGRTAMMPVNLASAALSPATEDEKKQGFTSYAMQPALAAHRLVVAPSNQTETMLEDQEAKDAAKGMPHSAIERWGNRAVNSIPILGPAIINEGQRAGQGDIAGAATDVAAAVALPHAIKEAMPGGRLATMVGETASDAAFPTASAGIRGVSNNLAGGMKTAGRFVRNPLNGVVDAAGYVGDKIGVTNLLEKGKNFGLSPDELRLKDMAPQLEKLQSNVNELQRRVDLASKTSSGYVPDELKSALEAAQEKLRAKHAEAARVHPVVDQFAQSLEAPEQTPPAPVIGRPAALSKIPVATDVQPVRGNPAALAEGQPFISRVEGMVDQATGSKMSPVKGQDLSIPTRPSENVVGGLPDRSYVTNPNMSTADTQARIAELYDAQQAAKAAPGGVRGVSAPAPVVEDAHPVKIVYDEYGQPTAETDGRHRVIQAIERGDERIPVLVDRGNGPVQTTIDPKVLAREMGVTKESLAATDEQQAYRKGNLQPREPVMRPVSKAQVSSAVDDALDVKPLAKDVPVKDQFKATGEGDMFKPTKESSSRAETQAFIDHGLSKAEGARLTKVLDQIGNASFGDFAAKNGVDMGQSIVSRAKGGSGAVNRGAVVKGLLSSMTPEEIEAAVSKYVGKE